MLAAPSIEIKLVATFHTVQVDVVVVGADRQRLAVRAELHVLHPLARLLGPEAHLEVLRAQHLQAARVEPHGQQCAVRGVGQGPRLAGDPAPAQAAAAGDAPHPHRPVVARRGVLVRVAGVRGQPPELPAPAVALAQPAARPGVHAQLVQLRAGRAHRHLRLLGVNVHGHRHRVRRRVLQPGQVEGRQLLHLGAPPDHPPVAAPGDEPAAVREVQAGHGPGVGPLDRPGHAVALPHVERARGGSRHGLAAHHHAAGDGLDLANLPKDPLSTGDIAALQAPELHSFYSTSDNLEIIIACEGHK
mmetsp:Transcript_41481/g.64886  ORF Transcript_41481/g.64886 Transcript_41481/m.64886 type:complete len:302 (-) Transcript_41481:507-1412(-)